MTHEADTRRMIMVSGMAEKDAPIQVTTQTLIMSNDIYTSEGDAEKTLGKRMNGASVKLLGATFAGGAVALAGLANIGEGVIHRSVPQIVKGATETVAGGYSMLYGMSRGPLMLDSAEQLHAIREVRSASNLYSDQEGN